MNKPIFITARFRSGSTMLWNLLRQIPNIVTYYEPLHEQLPCYIRNKISIQPTHYFVGDYFKEYTPLELLREKHLPEFGVARLFLETEDKHPLLKKYIQYLIDSVDKDKIPVLQFNRIDFRLFWIKSNFPEAWIIHLFRNPRDQWISLIEGQKEHVEKNIDADPFKITTWAKDLCRQFPFLSSNHIQHLYQRHYYLHKLSYLLGTRISHISLCYEDLLYNSEQTLRKLFNILGISEDNLYSCISVIKQKPINKWKEYHDDEWFQLMEDKCDLVLDNTKLTSNFGVNRLSEIIAKSPYYREIISKNNHIDWAHKTSQIEIVDLLNICDEKELQIRKLMEVAEERLQLINQQENAINQLNSYKESTKKQLELADQYKKVHENYIENNEKLIAQYIDHVDSLKQLVVQKDQVIQGFQSRDYVFRLKTKINLLKARFVPHLGVLNQYPPRNIYIPSWYHESKHLDSYPTISIVTPSYNQGKFLKGTIKSVLGQNYPELEYFVQDGGSDDDSVKILSSFKKSLFKWQSKKDKGQGNAINLGFEKSSGEIMAYLNSDDLLLPGTLNYIANYFDAHPNIDVVYGHRILIDEFDREIGRWVLPPHDDQVLLWVDYLPQETMFWRRSIWEKAGGFIDESFKFAMDWDLILRFREVGANFVRLPRFLGAFRVHESQKSIAEMDVHGNIEMQRLRKRCHKRNVSEHEINRKVRFYLYKHVLINKLYRMKVLQY